MFCLGVWLATFPNISPKRCEVRCQDTSKKRRIHATFQATTIRQPATIPQWTFHKVCDYQRLSFTTIATIPERLSCDYCQLLRLLFTTIPPGCYDYFTDRLRLSHDYHGQALRLSDTPQKEDNLAGLIEGMGDRRRTPAASTQLPRVKVKGRRLFRGVGLHPCPALGVVCRPDLCACDRRPAPDASRLQRIRSAGAEEGARVRQLSTSGRRHALITSRLLPPVCPPGVSLHALHPAQVVDPCPASWACLWGSYAPCLRLCCTALACAVNRCISLYIDCNRAGNARKAFFVLDRVTAYLA